VREALADQAVELVLVLERVDAGDDPPALWPSRNTGRTGLRALTISMNVARSVT
jgi:hypothetical protein